jgi:hypothetical protein
MARISRSQLEGLPIFPDEFTVNEIILLFVFPDRENVYRKSNLQQVGFLYIITVPRASWKPSLICYIKSIIHHSSS